MAFFKKRPSFKGGGLALFPDVHQAMGAEKALKAASYEVKLVAPPPELRKGCDLALEVNLTEKPGIERLFNERNIAYVDVVPLKVGTSELLEIVKVTDFGEWMMVKAGNMKLSFAKKSGIIVNTSGGGCPDIPYLHSELLDKKLTEAPEPRNIGFTLCALMLSRALAESRAIWQEGSKP